MKVKKEEIKKEVKKSVVLIVMSLAIISLFACGSNVETKTKYSSISIDQDNPVNSGDKINMTDKQEITGTDLIIFLTKRTQFTLKF